MDSDYEKFHRAGQIFLTMDKLNKEIFQKIYGEQRGNGLFEKREKSYGYELNGYRFYDNLGFFYSMNDLDKRKLYEWAKN